MPPGYPAHREPDGVDWSASALSVLTATELFDLADGQRAERPVVFKLLCAAASADLRGDRKMKYRMVLEIELAMQGREK